ncbi:hypothetical protein [Treponema sp. TIM-1]
MILIKEKKHERINHKRHLTLLLFDDSVFRPLAKSFGEGPGDEK